MSRDFRMGRKETVSAADSSNLPEKRQTTRKEIDMALFC